MPVSTTNSFSGPFNTNGVTTIFPFTFTAPSDTAVEVISRDDVTDADTVVSTSDYTVGRTIGGGGTITFGTAPASGAKIYIVLKPSFAQDVEFEDGSPLAMSLLNRVADESTARDQALKGELERAVKVRVGETAPSVGDITEQVEEMRALTQVVLAFSGPIYGTTSLGLDGTTNGDEFAVEGDTGTADIYLNDDGSAVFQRTVLIDPSAPTAAEHIGTADGTLQEVLTDLLARVTALEP